MVFNLTPGFASRRNVKAILATHLNALDFSNMFKLVVHCFAFFYVCLTYSINLLHNYLSVNTIYLSFLVFFFYYFGSTS